MQSHEDLRRNLSGREPSDRSFGLVFGGFFALLGLWPLLRGQPVRIWALAVSGLFLAFAWRYPMALGPANRWWMKLAHLLQRVVSPVVMGILYFVVLTPGAVIMRWCGRDALALRPDAARDSYWNPRTPPGPPARSMENQF